MIRHVKKWFKFIIGFMLWLAILRFFLVPRYCEIIHGNSNYLDSIIILILSALPLMLIFSKVDFFGLKLERDTRELSDANENILPPHPEPSQEVISFNESPFTSELDAHGDNTYLSFKARIHFSHEAGFQDLLKIRVNDIIIKAEHSVNKESDVIISDGRTFQCYNKDTQSWRIPYSPNFKSNYKHLSYRVLNGDAYYFIFDLTNIPYNENGKYTIEFRHNVKEGNEAFKNAIVIRNLDTF